MKKEKLQEKIGAIIVKLKSLIVKKFNNLHLFSGWQQAGKTESYKKDCNWIENIILSWWKRCEYYNLTKEEMEKIEELKEIYLKKFDELDKSGLDYWETPEALSGSTGTTVSDVEFVIKHTNDFVKNSKGRITTKKNYLKKESFIKRINDTLNGNID